MKEFISLWIYRFKRPFHFIKTGLMRGLLGQVRTGFVNHKLKIITITGTDGKTTSSTILHQVLTQAGFKVGLISTVAAYIGEAEIETGLHITSPDPYQLYQLLHQMYSAGIEYVILEVTSHGAYQHRAWGIKPTIAGLTNISHEHLDYHLNFNEYIKAKTLILKSAKKVVLNADDLNFSIIKNQLPQNSANKLNYSLNQKLSKKIDLAIKERFKEKYNWQNARLAATIAQELGANPNDIALGITNFSGVPGRMQEIITNKKFRVIVDFAHTPQAVGAALTALKSQLKSKQRRLITIYGSAGLRDRSKRPLMGQAGVDHADLVIFTAEDPRTEDVWSIIRQLKENLSADLDKVMSIPDRHQAIEFALTNLAKPGDIVAILGKGHEKSMCYGKTEIPWSDVEVATEILKS